MERERSSSADRPENTHTSICESISHLSASNGGEETRESRPGSTAVSTANLTASSTASGSQCSEPQSITDQPRSLGTASNGSANPSDQRLTGAHTTQQTAKPAMPSLMGLHATRDHGLGMPGSRQHSALHVAQWLEDQKRDNRIPYLGVMQQEMDYEGSAFEDKRVEKR
ncbi:hypothetical protein MMC22_010476 [Lobaria immixta]|nr:hypothetical protein [Lobaria immixta]